MHVCVCIWKIYSFVVIWQRNVFWPTGRPHPSIMLWPDLNLGTVSIKLMDTGITRNSSFVLFAFLIPVFQFIEIILKPKPLHQKIDRWNGPTSNAVSHQNSLEDL